MRSGRPERGLTLIELMIALSLLAIVLASLLAVFDSILSLSESSSNLTIATLDAQNVMEEVVEWDYDDLLNYAPVARTNLRDETITATITDEGGGPVGDPLPQIVRITVVVSWNERGSTVDTTLTTLRAKGF